MPAVLAVRIEPLSKPHRKAMKEREKKLTHERLCSVLSYNAKTGLFTWKEVTSNRVKVGDVAGQIDPHGHRIISVCGIRYSAHRLAWFYVHGEWPKDEIDHINLIKDDNRIANLREATHSENVRNVKMRRRNKTGFKGVIRHHQSPNKFVAQITVDRKVMYLGIFDDPKTAYAAYVEASLKHHGNFGRFS